MIKRAILILITITLAKTASAEYHYASLDGSNEYPYTSWATAALVIQDAVSAANPTDTVYVGNGEFADQHIFINSDSLSIIGQGWDSTFIWSETGISVTIYSDDYSHSYLYLEGLHVQNRSGTYCILNGEENNLHVNMCKFSASQIQTITSGIGTSAALDSIVIENCVFDSIGGAIQDFFLSNRTRIENCIFTNFYLNAIQLDNLHTLIKNCIFTDQVVDTYIIYGSSNTFLFRNNLVYGTLYISSVSSMVNEQINNTFSLTGGGPLVVLAGGIDRTIENNIVSNAEEFTSIAGGAYLHMAYNNFWNVETEARIIDGQLDTTGGNLRRNPMFVGNEDYHLQAYSPLIDAGNPSIFDPDSSRSDIGAYGGPGGEVYSYIDLPPAIPDNIVGEYAEDSVVINWRYNTEADFNRYQLHRDTISGFEPNTLNLIAEPDTSYYADSDISPGRSYFYEIAALDNQNNISDYSEELAVIPTGVKHDVGVEIPGFTSIISNYPNPFNSQTVIVYYVANLGPLPAQINIDIYDILGRKIRTLIDDREEVGEHKALWDGKDDAGSDCPSGVYFARISQWNVDYLDRHRKLSLLR
jgi:hypothetical protein